MARARRPPIPRRPSATRRITVTPAPTDRRLRLEEEPHAHVVCRVCGRIQPLELSELDRHLLTELAAMRPDGWNVERIAFSLTGSCRSCREGPARR